MNGNGSPSEQHLRTKSARLQNAGVQRPVSAMRPFCSHQRATRSESMLHGQNEHLPRGLITKAAVADKFCHERWLF